jgi:hypothetical protein
MKEPLNLLDDGNENTGIESAAFIRNLNKSKKNMAYKYTIKGIRKFNEQKVVERTMALFNTCSSGMTMLKRYNSPLDNEVLAVDDRYRPMSIRGLSSYSLLMNCTQTALPTWISCWVSVSKPVFMSRRNT